jgi:CubicO group peptidase (beta-lactamase class C family)
MIETAERSPAFLARAVFWNSSDVKDYEKFPAREIGSALPAFNFKAKPSPELFKTIDYQNGKQVLRADFDSFLKNTGTTSFIVIQDDTILYEKYFNGYSRDSIVTSFSIAKSIDSALIGIAIDEGYLKSVDDMVIPYVPELKGRGLNDMTIRHLLNMSSGIQYREEDQFFPFAAYMSDDAKTYYFPDLRQVAFSAHRGDEPVGAAFHYNNYHPLIEGLILERVTDRPVAQYLQEKIWSQIGMEYPASWSLDSRESGFEKMESGINARAIDFAKFGRLFLNLGNWEGKQIISPEWVLQSTSPDPNDNRPWATFQDYQASGGFYKYHWWGIDKGDGRYDYFARGHLGQIICISPEKRLVIVRFGWETGPSVLWYEILERMSGRF